jgi:hypothetical protein
LPVAGRTIPLSPGSDCRRLPLRLFLDKIEKQKGKARRVWIMDRGIPTEEILGEMRQCETPVYYLVGTPKGRLNKLEKELLPLQWAEVHENLAVKLLKQDGELYVLASSRNRQAKERSMRRRRLKRYWNRLKEIRNQNLDLYHLLMKSGAAKKEAGRAAGLVDVTLPLIGQPVTPETFNFQLRRDKLRHVRRQEGQYLLRSNLCAEDPAVLWKYYMVLVEMEEAFKTLKMDLSVRPVFHQKDERIEGHIFVAFLSYSLQMTLKQRLKDLAPGLTVRSVLEKFASIQMIEVHLPTTEGNELLLRRYTQPNKDQILLLSRLNLTLPEQPKPQLLRKPPEMKRLRMHV